MVSFVFLSAVGPGEKGGITNKNKWKPTGVLKSVSYYITGNTNICIIHRTISDFQHIFDIQLLVEMEWSKNRKTDHK